MDIDAIINANGSLYRTSFPDLGIALSYRLLSLKEYKVFKSLRDGGVISPFIVSEKVFERCYIGEYKLIPDSQLAGVGITIGNLIMWLSGDCDSETLLNDIAFSRRLNPRDTVFEYMRGAIVAAFPTTTIEELENLTRNQFINKFTISENVIAKQNPEYEELNLSEVAKQSETQSVKTKHGINFERENQAIVKAVGANNIRDQEVAESKAIREKQPKKKKPVKLSNAQLRELQKRKMHE